MNSAQFEELCRLHIAELFGLSLEAIISSRLPGKHLPQLANLLHQIDLYWEIGNSGALYRNIANAKWRTSEKVDQPEVLLLHKVMQETGAHKAFMLTNVGFTDGARAVAANNGVALHIVNPSVAIAAMPDADRAQMQAFLASAVPPLGKSVYSAEVHHRGIEAGSHVSNPTVVNRPHTAPLGVQAFRPAPAGGGASLPMARPARGSGGGVQATRGPFGGGLSKR